MKNIVGALMLVLTLSACDIAAIDNPYAGRAAPNPVAVSGSRQYLRVAGGFFHTCAISTAGEGWCWGSNEYLQLGTSAALPLCESFRCSRAPLRVSGSLVLTEIAAGVTSTCAITNAARAYCWGGGYPNAPPALGDSSIVSSSTPVRVLSDSQMVQIAVGGAHACALTPGGTALCWGDNQFGQLGDGTTSHRAMPVVVSNALRFASITAGSGWTCGVEKNSGAGYCWGSNRWGQIGVGEVAYNSFGLNELRPREIIGARRWAQLTAGMDHTCGLTVAGAAFCWGRNENAAQLGDSSYVTHRGVPAAVAGSRTFDAIAAGAVSTCAHAASNELYCWGSNYFGGLGNGQTAAGGVNHPVRNVGGPYRGGPSASVGGSHACAIKSDGSLACWGDAFYGQTGDR